jgi:glyoxylase-like metal-dependent hydrolase (beta-lactamase superfamily II)
MAHVKILVNGYAKKRPGYELASPNTVLIFDGTQKILVDPGSNKRLLLKGLKKEHLKPRDIDVVLITHYHLDHILNIRLFPEHDIYDGDTINRADKIIGYSSNVPRTSIKVIPTPGHAHEHCSFLVQTAQGKVVIAGDIFWWSEREKQKIDKKSLLKKKDPYVKNKADLLQSRKKLLAVADYIIPGHGKMFKVEK